MKFQILNFFHPKFDPINNGKIHAECIAHLEALSYVILMHFQSILYDLENVCEAVGITLIAFLNNIFDLVKGLFFLIILIDISEPSLVLICLLIFFKLGFFLIKSITSCQEQKSFRLEKTFLIKSFYQVLSTTNYTLVL